MDWKERTKQLLKKKKTSQAELGRKLGMTRATISAWLSDLTLSDANTLKAQHLIATALDVNVEYLIHGVNKGKVADTAVPLLAFKDISTWVANSVADSDAKWVSCPEPCGAKTYACHIQGSTMTNPYPGELSLPADTLVFVDPEHPLTENRLCIFMDKDVLIGNYELLNGEPVLTPSNPRFSHFSVTKNKYLGTIIGFYRSLWK